MNIKLFVAILLFSSVADSKYLTYKLDEDVKNLTDDRYTIELWPDYIPNPRWAIETDNCRYDVKIKFIPFSNDRMIDYNARIQGVLPSLDLSYFWGKNLLPTFERMARKSPTCNYDAVWYEHPARFYGYHGFKASVYDSLHNYSWMGYGPVPFLRNVDAVFRDPRTQRTVIISNHWYYAFGFHGQFSKQGRLAYLWSNFQSSKYVDSVLVTHNKTLCRFYDDRIHCARFDNVTKRLVDAPSDWPRPFSEVFAGDRTPAFPLKGSFWVPTRNQTAILDSNDTFWIYDRNDTFSHTTPFCEYMSFGKFPCCRAVAAKTTTTPPVLTTVSNSTDNFNSANNVTEETATNATVFTEEGKTTTAADEIEIVTNASDILSSDLDTTTVLTTILTTAIANLTIDDEDYDIPWWTLISGFFLF